MGTKTNIRAVAKSWKSIGGGRSHKWKDGPILGTLVRVQIVEGGIYDKSQARIFLDRGDGEGVPVYLPEGWADRLALYIGARVYIERKGEGLAARYDVKIDPKAKPSKRPADVERVVQTARTGRKAKGKRRRAA